MFLKKQNSILKFCLKTFLGSRTCAIWKRSFFMNVFEVSIKSMFWISGMYTQGRPVRPRLHLNFLIPKPYPNQGGQILPIIAEVEPKFSPWLRPWISYWWPLPSYHALIYLNFIGSWNLKMFIQSLGINVHCSKQFRETTLCSDI